LRIFLTVIFLVLLAYAIGFVLFVSNLPAPPTMLPKADGIVALTGVGKRLLISGVAPTATKQEVGRLSEGGPRFLCCADLGYAAEDTHGNAREAADWAHENHFASLVIVTGRYHMPRTLREFSTAMPDITLIAYPVDQAGIDLSGWWTHPRTVRLLHREYVKFLFSVVTTRLAAA
jgi:uncharacterized SAM-binding protein YcdF (DUF218 family)